MPYKAAMIVWAISGMSMMRAIRAAPANKEKLAKRYSPPWVDRLMTSSHNTVRTAPAIPVTKLTAQNSSGGKAVTYTATAQTAGKSKAHTEQATITGRLKGLKAELRPAKCIKT